MSRKSKRGEMPKPVIQTDTLGMTPLNRWTASCLNTGKTECILAYRDKPETFAFKSQPRLHLTDTAGKTEVLSLEGRVFNGYTDALYRGRLPEVLLAAPSFHEWPVLLNDFVEYLEQMLSMGFFLPKKDLVRRDPVEQMIPCIVLTGSGMLFSRFITTLSLSLRELGKQHPVMNDTLQTRIIGRFLRGVVDPAEGETRMDDVDLSISPGSVAQALPTPRHIRIAGGDQNSQALARTVLSQAGLVVSIENRAENAIERLEVESSVWRLAKVIVPTLAQRQSISSKEASRLLPEIQAGILTVGRHHRIFDPVEEPDWKLWEAQAPATPQKASGKSKSKTAAPLPTGIRHTDIDFLANLGRYADRMGLSREKKLFESLAIQAARVLQS